MIKNTTDAAIPWNPAWELGISELDADHQHLVQVLNRLLAQLDGPLEDGRQHLWQTMDQLDSYAREHFDREERYADDHRYPWAEEHKTDHAGFRTRLGTFRDQLEDAPRDILGRELVGFLRKWLHEHILFHDKRLASFILEGEAPSRPESGGVYQGDAFDEIFLFRGVDYQTIGGILERCPVRKLAQDEVLLSPNRRNSFLFVVLDGVLTVHLRDLEATAIATISMGGCVGELSLIDDRPASAFVKAQGPTRVLAINKDQFSALMNRASQLAFNLLRVLTERMRNSTEALVESQFVRTVPDIIYRINKDGRFIFLNDSVQKLGFTVDELMGEHFTVLLPEEELDRASYTHFIKRLREGRGAPPNAPPKLFDERRSDHRKTIGLELKLRTKLQRELEPGAPVVAPPDIIIAEVSCTGIQPEDPTNPADSYAGTVGIIRDVTERKIFQAQLADQKARMEAIFQTMSDALVVVNAEGRIESVNAAATALFNFPEEELVGQEAAILMPKAFSERRPGLFRRFLTTQAPRVIGQRLEMIGTRRGGRDFNLDLSVSEIRLQNGLLFAGIIRDITERKEAERLIHYQANYDALTDLPNRAMFLGALGTALAEAKEKEQRLALLFIDLDRFKWVNDNLGHAAGDALLKLSAQRIAGCVGPKDIVARLGGDEFTALLVDCGDGEAVTGVTRAILDQLNAPFELEGKETFISGSLGVAQFPQDIPAGTAQETDELLKLADEAMYRSKKAGRNAYHFWSGASFIQEKRY